MKLQKLEKLRVMPKWCLVAKNQTKRAGAIHLPDSYAEHNSPTVRVVSVGRDSNPAIRTGLDCIVDRLNKFAKQTFNFDGYECYFIPSVEIKGAIIKGKVLPLGNTVLIKRVFRSQSSDLVKIPDNYTDRQTLEGQVVAMGLMNDGSEFHSNGLKIGQHVRLTGWEESMTELNIGAYYHLIVEKKHILAAI